MRPVTLALVLACSAGAARLAAAEPVRAGAAYAAQRPDSLEGLLARARAQEAAALETIRPEVERRFGELQVAVVEGRRRPIEAARTNLIELGPIAAPLLVEHLDPGDPADPDTRAIAVRVSQVLVETRPSSITERLIDITRTGTLDGRLNAVRVLAETPEPDRVRPALVELYRRTEGPLRSASLSALARLGGEESRALLGAALDDPSGDIVGIALRALADVRAVDAAPRVLAFLSGSVRAAENVSELLSYYRACPQALDAAHVAALLDLAAGTRAPLEDRIAILATLGKHPEAVNDKERDRLRQVATAQSPDLREAALICLAVLGDRAARRELIEPYDERIDKNKAWAKGYESRGAVLYRIGDYRDAIRDYKKALDLGTADPRVRQEEAYVGLARCYALSGKLREAAQTLQDAPITAADVRALASDPDFAELLASSRYGDVFDVDGR